MHKSKPFRRYLRYYVEVAVPPPAYVKGHVSGHITGDEGQLRRRPRPPRDSHLATDSCLGFRYMHLRDGTVGWFHKDPHQTEDGARYFYPFRNQATGRDWLVPDEDIEAYWASKGWPKPADPVKS